jgi:AraC-like DNA-binding protein
MLSHTYVPKPPLADFVALFWLYEGRQLPHAKERVLPDGCMELVINLRDDALRVYDRDDHHSFESFGSSLMVGAHSRFIVIDTANQASVMGVHFKPGGAFPFLKAPAAELQNIHASLSALWGVEADFLRERLLEAQSPEAKFHILEEALLTQATDALERHPAVAYALGALTLPAQTVSGVMERIGLSSRRLSQLFNEEVGLTPKRFYRVRRFHRALRRIERGQFEWADLALGCGYYDQAHFIHDFKSFSGLSPSDYLIRGGERFGHVPLAG